jgi:hypothetical protein
MFIRGHFIQDNFKLFQASTKLFHAWKCACPLLKIHVARALDSVAWPFPLEIIEHVGFSRLWRNWTSILLSMASTRVMLNGDPREKIYHAHGLWKGDLLSPMLFILVMEVLNSLIHKADGWSLLQPLGVRPISHHESFYADDLVMFISPSTQDLHVAHNILSLFEDSSGLGCNMAKCQMAPIRCSDDQVALVTSPFPCQKVDFLIKYLGIPLSVMRLPESALQPLLDCVADKLPSWKGRLMHRSSRLTLIKTTMSVVPVYTSINIGLPPWLLEAS